MKFRCLCYGAFIILVAAHVGCVLEHAVSPTPLAHAQAVANIAVIIEDHFEDPECDRQETSILEAVSDVLNLPVTFISTAAVYFPALGWTLLDFGSQTYEILWKGMLVPETKIDPAHRFAQIREWIPIHFAGVERPLDGKPVRNASCPTTASKNYRSASDS